jgi:hypothetical protein
MIAIASEGKTQGELHNARIARQRCDLPGRTAGDVSKFTPVVRQKLWPTLKSMT